VVRSKSSQRSMTTCGREWLCLWIPNDHFQARRDLKTSASMNRGWCRCKRNSVATSREMDKNSPHLTVMAIMILALAPRKASNPRTFSLPMLKSIDFPRAGACFLRGCLSASMCRRRRRSRGLLTKAQLRQSANEADRRATVLPEGLERQRLVKWARMARVAADIDRWLSSPGLRPPT